jgi:hypothetical protein
MSDVWMLLLVFAGLMVLAFVYAARVRQRPPTFREEVIRITAEVEAFREAIDLRLLPVMLGAQKALLEFAETVVKAQGVTGESEDER